MRSTDFTYSYEQNPPDARNPVYSFLLSVTQKRLQARTADGTISSVRCRRWSSSTPSRSISDDCREVDAESLENLPIGLDGGDYQWIDLDGEGISGMLTEQADGWFYKRNLSPTKPEKELDGEAHRSKLAPVEQVAQRPTSRSGRLARSSSTWRAMASSTWCDAGRPVAGLLRARTETGAGSAFVPFTRCLNRTGPIPT